MLRRRGREAQLKVYEKYMAGEEATFKGPTGPKSSYTTKRDESKDIRNGPKNTIKFDQTTVFLDAASAQDEETGWLRLRLLRRPSFSVPRLKSYIKQRFFSGSLCLFLICRLSCITIFCPTLQCLRCLKMGLTQTAATVKG